jgi:hypothetical protein
MPDAAPSPDTAETLHAALAVARPSRSNVGYPADLRARAGTWAARAQSNGATWTAVASSLGVSNTSVRSWALSARESAPAGPQSGFVAVTLSAGRRASGSPAETAAVLRTPAGYLVTGLTPAELLTVLRGLE